jgi:glycolate oxidase FAD binding subunit
LIKAGGNVVKNVAGYDIGRLMSGSHGSLAAIVSATFKLSPLPAATRTLVATFDRAETLVTAVSAITSSQLEPAAVEIRTGSSAGSAFRLTYGLLLKFESTPTALDTYVQRARALMQPADSQVVSSQSEIDLWREHIRAPWQSPGMVFRFAWMPASLGAVLALIEELRNTVADVELSGRAALGSGLLRIDADVRVQRNIVERMRSRSDVFRHVVVLRAEPQLKEQLDVWGPLGDAGSLGASVKHALDPNGILNAGRGPV